MDSEAKDGVSAIPNKKGHFSDGDEDANMAIITFYRHARPFCTMSKDQLVKNTMAYQSTTAYQKACEYGLTY